MYVGSCQTKLSQIEHLLPSLSLLTLFISEPSNCSFPNWCFILKLLSFSSPKRVIFIKRGEKQKIVDLEGQKLLFNKGNYQEPINNVPKGQKSPSSTCFLKVAKAASPNTFTAIKAHEYGCDDLAGDIFILWSLWETEGSGGRI